MTQAAEKMKAIIAALITLGWTLKTIAGYRGVSLQCVSEWSRGKSGGTFAQRAKLEGLGAPTSALLARRLAAYRARIGRIVGTVDERKAELLARAEGGVVVRRTTWYTYTIDVVTWVETLTETQGGTYCGEHDVFKEENQQIKRLETYCSYLEG